MEIRVRDYGKGDAVLMDDGSLFDEWYKRIRAYHARRKIHRIPKPLRFLFTRKRGGKWLRGLPAGFNRKSRPSDLRNRSKDGNK